MSADHVRIAVPVTSVWRAPDSASPADLAVTRAEPDAGAWADSLDVEARLGLSGRLDTQALLGEPALAVGERDGWTQVRLPWQPSGSALEGYPGWVPTAHLVADQDAPVDPADGAVVIARLAIATSERGGDLRVSLGTVLSVLDATSTEVRLRHPAGHTLRLDRADVALPGERAERDIIALAQSFMGRSYLWGGMSGYGVDCSALVHLSHRVLGRVVPRDAHDQALIGARVSRAEVRAGDAVYLENATGVHHTGFALDAERLLHSPCTGKRVSVGSIREDYPGERHAFRRFAPSP